MEQTAAIGEVIATQRRRRGLSQVKLGKLLNRSESWVSQVERGVLHIDRLSVLLDVARVLEVAPGDLLSGIPVTAAAGQGRPVTRHEAIGYATDYAQEARRSTGNADHAKDAEERAQFLREAQTYAAVSHAWSALAALLHR